jgi:pyridoxine 5-phosphate synthase
LLQQINSAIEYAHAQGLQVNAGHGLNLFNVRPVAANPRVVELNIGHALVADAVFRGLAGAVSEMKRVMLEARYGRI